MAGELINRKACKEFAVRYAQDARKGWCPTRCSQRFLDDINSHLMLAIQKSVMMHRSVGKTVLDFH